MIRRIFLVVASMGLLLALGAAPASAQYTPTNISINDNTLYVGQPFTVTVIGQQPGSSGSFTFNSAPVALGSATADAAGTTTLNSTTPNVPLGAHTITFVGTAADGSPSNLSVGVTVIAANATPAPTTPSSTGTLPRTGSNSTGTLLPIAAVLVAGGAMMVIITRKRNATNA